MSGRPTSGSSPSSPDRPWLDARRRGAGLVNRRGGRSDRRTRNRQPRYVGRVPDRPGGPMPAVTVHAPVPADQVHLPVSAAIAERRGSSSRELDRAGALGADGDPAATARTPTVLVIRAVPVGTAVSSSRDSAAAEAPPRASPVRLPTSGSIGRIPTRTEFAGGASADASPRRERLSATLIEQESPPSATPIHSRAVGATDGGGPPTCPHEALVATACTPSNPTADCTSGPSSSESGHAGSAARAPPVHAGPTVT